MLKIKGEKFRLHLKSSIYSQILGGKEIVKTVTK